MICFNIEVWELLAIAWPAASDAFSLGVAAVPPFTGDLHLTVSGRKR